MRKKIGIKIILLLSCGLCLAGCGKKEAEESAPQPAEPVAEVSAQQETKIEGLDAYLELAAQVDVLQQKKEMLYSLRNNTGVLMMPVEEQPELLSAQDFIGTSHRTEPQTGEDQALVIEDMRSFWNVYDSLTGNVKEEAAPTEGMDQVLQSLNEQKNSLEIEVAALEGEYRTPLEYGFDNLDDGQWEEKLPEEVEKKKNLAQKRGEQGWSKLKVERLDAGEGWTAFYLKVIETNYPGLSAGDYIYVGGGEGDSETDHFEPLLFGNYIEDKLTFEAILDKTPSYGSDWYRIAEFLGR